MAIVQEAELRDGVLFAKRWGFFQCTLESDSLTVIAQLRSNTEGFIMEDILSLTKYSSCNFEYVNRGGNNVAHILTHYCFQYNTPAIWLNEPSVVLLLMYS